MQSGFVEKKTAQMSGQLPAALGCDRLTLHACAPRRISPLGIPGALKHSYSEPKADS